jgi:hypothetical protein
MSSRSLAAARARRAGENAPPVSGNRPGTSIGSQAAFAQQMPPHMSYNMPPPPNNVRIGKQPQQPSQAYQQVQQSQQQSKNGLPFSKLSISDAIGLITLRLGRVEQWVIETEHENETKEEMTQHSNIPENSTIIDNSVFSSIMNRLETVEKKEPGTVNSEDVTKLSEDVAKLNEQLAKIVDEGVKHNLSIAKHTEQLFKFERELVETKDILKTFMIKYDLFASDTNNKFADYEFALSELEKNIQPAAEPTAEVKEEEGTTINDIDSNENENANTIMSVDLKNIIKQELANNA